MGAWGNEAPSLAAAGEPVDFDRGPQTTGYLRPLPSRADVPAPLDRARLAAYCHDRVNPPLVRRFGEKFLWDTTTSLRTFVGHLRDVANTSRHRRRGWPLWNRSAMPYG